MHLEPEEEIQTILYICGFICAIYYAGRFLSLLKLPPVLGEIAVGVVLGPHVAGFFPREATYWFKLMGMFGVTLAVFESGMHMQFNKLKQVVFKGFFVATLGTTLPIAGGIVYAAILGYGVYPDGLALGCAMAPTSVGLAMKLLTAAKVSSTMYGQTIVTAAFIDDVYSIVALVLLVNVCKGAQTIQALLWPILESVCFLLVGGTLAFQFYPRVIPYFLSKCRPSNKKVALEPRHQLHLACMAIVLVGYSWLASLIGSHFLGTFLAGLSFSRVPRSVRVWNRQLKRITHWSLRFFFACTVAFSIPISIMGNLSAFWKGLVCSLIPCILTKFISGFFLGVEKWVVGSAMVGRGEFAFLVAELAGTTKIAGTERQLMAEETYAVCVWALVLAMLVAPFMFKFFLARHVARSQVTGVTGFRLKVKGQYYPGMVHEIMDVLRLMNIEATESMVETDNVVCILTLTCKTSVQDDYLDDEKFEDIRRNLFESLNDDDGQIMISAFRGPQCNTVHDGPLDRPLHVAGTFYQPGRMPCSFEPPHGIERAHYIVIKVMSDHYRHFLVEATGILAAQGLDVRRSKMYKAGKTSIKTFYTLEQDGQNDHHPPERLQQLRERLGAEFKFHGMRAKALVKTVRVVNAPNIYGFTPYLERGNHVGEFNIWAEHHPDTLHQVNKLLYDLDFDVINMTCDRHGQSDYDYTTMFALNYVWLTAESQDAVAEKVITVFRRHGLQAQVSVKLYSYDTSPTGQDATLTQTEGDVMSPRSAERTRARWPLTPLAAAVAINLPKDINSSLPNEDFAQRQGRREGSLQSDMTENGPSTSTSINVNVNGQKRDLSPDALDIVMSYFNSTSPLNNMTRFSTSPQSGETPHIPKTLESTLLRDHGMQVAPDSIVHPHEDIREMVPLSVKPVPKARPKSPKKPITKSPLKSRSPKPHSPSKTRLMRSATGQPRSSSKSPGPLTATEKEEVALKRTYSR